MAVRLPDALERRPGGPQDERLARIVSTTLETVNSVPYCSLFLGHTSNSLFSITQPHTSHGCFPIAVAVLRRVCNVDSWAQAQADVRTGMSTRTHTCLVYIAPCIHLAPLSSVRGDYSKTFDFQVYLRSAFPQLSRRWIDIRSDMPGYPVLQQVMTNRVIEAQTKGTKRARNRLG